MATYFTLLTKTGQAKIANAVALGQSVAITKMAVGDGNGNPTTPSETQTALVRERYRANINQLNVDSTNPNYIVAEMVVPTTEGGWNVTEVGVFDGDGNLLAVANFPLTYKPQLAEGSGRDLTVRIYIQVSNTSVVQLVVDPAVTLASQKWVVDNFVKHTAVAGGTTGQVLAKKSNANEDFQWIDPTAAVNVVVTTKDEIQTLAANQLIVDLAKITTNGVGVYVEGVRLRSDEYAINTATRVTLAQSYAAGTKVQFVQNDQTGVSLLARLDGANFTGPVTLATPPQFDNDTSGATTEFVQRALGNFRDAVVISGSTTLTAADGGKHIGVPTAPSNQVITLPAKSTLPPGWAVTISSVNGTPTTINCQGSDTIDNVNPAGAQASITIGYGESVTIIAGIAAGTKFQAIGANGASLKYSPMFGASLGTSGYQKLPSGLIVQWGTFTGSSSGDTGITFPIAFPSTFYTALVSGQNSGTGAWGGYNTATVTGMNGNWWSATGTRQSGLCSYMAFGK